ncbi:MAG TPA: transcriptional regulator, partial [Candidatus Moranbacteria bacterium]|nr:transcriptional regulator [Candidatus Moranbacteria bacterium]
MIIEKIKKIIADGENGNIELKLSFSDEVIISLVAMANFKGGRVIVGVGDNKKISGVKLNSESLVHWANEIKNKTQPFLSVDIEKHIIDKKTIVIFEVSEFPLKPVSFKGRFYVRKNNANHLLTLQEISEMYLRTKNSSWDFYPNKEKSLNDLDTEKIEKVKIMIEKNLAVSLGDNFSFLRKYSGSYAIYG